MKKPANNFQDTPQIIELRKAVFNGDLGGVQDFFKQNPKFNINQPLTQNGQTALHIAGTYENGAQDVAQYLITKKGANLDVKNQAGQTPLDLAKSLSDGKAAPVVGFLEQKHIELEAKKTTSLQQSNDENKKPENHEDSPKFVSRLKRPPSPTREDPNKWRKLAEEKAAPNRGGGGRE